LASWWCRYHLTQGLGRADEDTRGGFTHGGWGEQYNDEVLGREMGNAMAKPGDMLFGRRTWQDFISAWGRSADGNPFTAHLNAATKYLVSRNLTDADAWQNSILLHGGAWLFECPAPLTKFELTRSVATTTGVITAQYTRR
jgi:hypothetical protein